MNDINVENLVQKSQRRKVEEEECKTARLWAVTTKYYSINKKPRWNKTYISAFLALTINIKRECHGFCLIVTYTIDLKMKLAFNSW